MRTGTMLRLQATDGLAPLGAFSQPVHKSYAQVRAAVLQDLGPGFADYFARPDVDPGADRLGWHAHQPGNPRRWIDLAPDERAALEPARLRLREGFNAYLQRLSESSENSTRSNFRKILEQALQCPSAEYLYVVEPEDRLSHRSANPLADEATSPTEAAVAKDPQFVLAFWGFRPADKAEGFDPLAFREPVEVPVAPVAAASPAALVAPVAAAGFPWLRWLLLGLLLLLLLLLLLWWLYTRQPPFSWLPRWGVPPAVEIVIPEGTVPTPRAQVPEAVLPELPVRPVAPEKLPAPVETKPVPQLPRAEVAPPEVKDAPKALTMPDDFAKDQSFLEGTWRNRTGLRLGDKPVDVYYKVGPDGKGQMFLKLPGQDGYCTGPVSIGTDEKSLNFSQSDPLTCPNGATVNRARVTCVRGADGKASCDGVNLQDNGADDSHFTVDMERVDSLP